MSSIVVDITPPGGSPTDYASACIFERCSFSTSMNAAPGSFDILIRDPNRTLSFSTGSEIALMIDGVPMFGGYVLQVGMTSLAPAAPTSDLASYDLRVWHLSGSDYNILFDKRVWRDDSSPPTSYLSAINLSGSQADGAVLRNLVDNYADMSGFDTSGIEDNATLASGYVVQQGDTMRRDFQYISVVGSSIYYIRGDKTIIFTPFEDVTKSWGFSDDPNRTTTFGFNTVEATEDGSFISNDVFIWGGSEFAGSGQTVVSRKQDSTSESTYGRWQYAETHFGELNYRSQAEVDATANAIVLGPPGQTADEQTRGLRYSQFQFTFNWNSEDVPGDDHLVAGDIIEIDLTTFSFDKLLPLRSLNISFPNAFETDGTHMVVFQGTFGLQLSDPFTLWAYLLKQKARLETIQVSPAAVTPSSTQAVYGAIYQGAPTPACNGSQTVFTLPLGTGVLSYIPATLQVYMGTIGTPGAGLLATGTDFAETSPDNGTFTMTVAPANTKFLYVTCLAQPSAQ